MRFFASVLAVACASAHGPAAAEPHPLAAAVKPSEGPAEAIGGYSRGCVRGAAELPARGPGFQVMKPARNRAFGHPELVDYVVDLGARVKESGLGVILIGDLAQPRGGPAPSGHASHQSGLDADIWFWHPPKAVRRRLSRHERNRIEPRPIVDLDDKKPSNEWSGDVAKLLKQAVRDERVARIFVNPLIKKELCESEKKDRSWLRKLRPWYGHHRHFHVRLRCPEGSDQCEDQKELPAGDGCAGLDWWLDEEKQAERKKGRKTYRKKVGAVPEMPAACSELVPASATRAAAK